MRILKYIMLLVLAIVISAALLLGLLYCFVNPNQFKPLLISEVKKHTGFNLAIDDGMSWTLYPRMAVSVPHMTLTANNQSVPFADMRNVKLAADLHQRGDSLLQSHITIGELRFDKVVGTDVSAEVTWQNNELHINPIRAEFYKGVLTGSVIGRDVKTAPKWEGALTLTNVHIKSLMQDLSPANKFVIDAMGSLSLQAHTEGRGREELVSHLNGNVLFNTGAGTVHGLDINYLVSTADAIINKQPIAAPTNVYQTAFTSLNGSAVIEDGVVKFDTIQLVAPTFVTIGQGTINLVQNGLDIILTTKPEQQMTTKWGVIIKITGALEHPVIKLDADQMTKYTIKQQIDKAKEKAREAVQKHVPGKMGDYLQKLLSR